MSQLPTFSTGLYWSTRGHVACADHAAQIVNSRWAAEGWSPMPPSSQGFRGIRYKCDYCSPQRTVFAEPTGSPRPFVLRG